MTPEPIVVHAYGVVPHGHETDLPLAGVLGAAVERIDCGAHDVIASVHPDSQFGARCWEANGQDPGWLAPVARQHHEVLQRIVEAADVVPLRLPGIFADRDQLSSTVSARAEQLSAAFDVVRGHVEWTVKVWRENVVELPTQPPASGADYLRQRSLQATERDRRHEQSAGTALAVHEHLAMVASQSVVSPVHGREVTGRREAMVLNGAYLVGRSVREQFFAAADRQAQQWGPRGFVIEVTGPWPAYSFTTVRLEQVAAS